MEFAPPGGHLVRARDLADARYREDVGVADMAKAAGLSRAHFGKEFRRVFGTSPHVYVLTRATRAGGGTAPNVGPLGARDPPRRETQERRLGIDCGFRDPSGNHLRLTELRM